MFGIEGLDNYNYNIREIEGIFESKNRLYQIKYLPKGGYHHTITDKEIDKVNDNEYNIKLYFEGSSEGGEIQKTESPTFNLKYNEDKNNNNTSNDILASLINTDLCLTCSAFTFISLAIIFTTHIAYDIYSYHTNLL